jgi:phosphatidylethanolamine-binding protein
MKSIFLTIVVIFAVSLADEVDDKFRSAKIVDDILPRSPGALLDVEFDCGSVKLGSKFAPLQVRNRPKVTWKGAKESEFYSLIMTDAEGKDTEWIHWHVGNIQGNNVDKGDVLTAFFPSAPPKNTGEHRYVFLLFKQPAKIDFNGHVVIPTFEMDGRNKFSTKAFVEKFKLGTPVAGNFYLAAWDESCIEIDKLVEENARKN